MTIQKAYTRWSATYDADRNRTRDLDQTVTRRMLSDLRCHSILELGCGTGKNTLFLAEISEKVLALDFSEGMLAVAKEKVKQAHVTFAVADLTHPWPGADQSAELIVCNLVLEHIDDLSFIFAEASRILEKGGRFFLCELHSFRQYEGTVANFQQNEETTAIPAFIHHISDYLHAARSNGFTLIRLDEWWHAEDNNRSPRLISFLFEK